MHHYYSIEISVQNFLATTLLSSNRLSRNCCWMLVSYEFTFLNSLSDSLCSKRSQLMKAIIIFCMSCKESLSFLYSILRGFNSLGSSAPLMTIPSWLRDVPPTYEIEYNLYNIANEARAADITFVPDVISATISEASNPSFNR